MKQEVKEEEIKDEEVKDEPESDDEDDSGIHSIFLKTGNFAKICGKYKSGSDKFYRVLEIF